MRSSTIVNVHGVGEAFAEVRLLRELVGADNASIPEVWQARVELSPDRTFLLIGDRRWSYAEAWREIRSFGGFLEEQGLGGSGQRVASYLSNHAETLWAWFGTVVTGAAYFALNREHRGSVLSDMISRCGARTLVTEASALPVLETLGSLPFETIVFVDTVPEGGKKLASLVRSYASAVCGQSLTTIARPQPLDLAGILFTSGTTGRSKAVLLPHNAYCRGAARVSEAWGWREDDVFHAWMPLFHIAGQMHQTMSMVVVGGAIAQFPTFSKSRFWDQVAASGATIVCGVANVLHLLWQVPRCRDDAHSTLRSVISAAIPRELHHAFEERFGVHMMEQYGMTEAELLTLPSGPDDRIPLGSCGRAGPDFELAVVDVADQTLPAGGVGEIVVRPRAPGLLMLGYEGDEAATVQAWRNLWFHTGDFGYFDDGGYLYYVDRMKHVIRRRSENISSFELERTLNACTAVAECAAIGVPSPLGEQDVMVFVVLRERSEATARDIYDYCVGNMARFMVPRYIEIVDELPHNHVGKIEKEKLLAARSDRVWDAEIEVVRRGPGA